MELTYSKGQALHRMYGCELFRTEARKANKAEKWITHICQSLRCKTARGLPL